MRAEWHAINARFMLFANEVYDRGGLYNKICKCTHRGMIHTLGDTQLRSYELAGRIMFTFARKTEDGEALVTFICDSDDPHGITGGLSHQSADLATVIQMIDEVRARWADEGKKFQVASSVSFI